MGHSVNRSKLNCFNTTNGERNMLYQLLELLFAANHVQLYEHFKIITSVSILTQAQDLWYMLKYMSNL